jgi:hypothetical protein
MLETFSFIAVLIVGLLAVISSLACEINNKKYTSKKN